MENEKIIYNKYDYSNIIPNINHICYLVKYCENTYHWLENLCREEEIKNQQIKYELKNYKYKKSWKSNFDIYIVQKDYKNITCKDYNTFINAINTGKVSNINKLEIKLELGYGRGINGEIKDHENEFIIRFEPYNIIFTRSSNHKEDEMDHIENSINQILNNFQIMNTIFCKK